MVIRKRGRGTVHKRTRRIYCLNKINDTVSEELGAVQNQIEALLARPDKSILDQAMLSRLQQFRFILESISIHIAICEKGY